MAPCAADYSSDSERYLISPFVRYPVGWGASLIGARATNQDALLVESSLGIYALADGIGGSAGGGVASTVVLDTLNDYFRERGDDQTWEEGNEALMLRLSIASAQLGLFEQATGRLRAMGTTLAVLQMRDEHAVVAHVGDSRVYRLRAGDLSLLTDDHSVGKRFPDRVSGGLSAGALTRALAWDTDGTPDLLVLDRRPGDLYLLCTDGVTGAVNDAQIKGLLCHTKPSFCAARCVSLAIRAGGLDNASAIVVFDRDPPAVAGQSY